MSKSAKGRSVAALLGLLFVGPAIGSQSLSQPAPPSQFDVQSVYLFDFAKFVRWPAGKDHEALSICVAGERRYVESLSKIIEGEQIDSRPLAVHVVDRPEDVGDCQILFISVAARERLDSLLAAASGRPILTVSDIPGFLEHGGMINFLIIGKRIRFSVDLRAVARSGISLSSELLKVAIAVNGRPAVGGQ